MGDRAGKDAEPTKNDPGAGVRSDPAAGPHHQSDTRHRRVPGRRPLRRIQRHQRPAAHGPRIVRDRPRRRCGRKGCNDAPEGREDRAPRPQTRRGSLGGIDRCANCPLPRLLQCRGDFRRHHDDRSSPCCCRCNRHTAGPRRIDHVSRSAPTTTDQPSSETRRF